MNPTPGTQMPRPGDFIVWDVEHLSRERIEIDSTAPVLLAGQLLARLDTGYWVAYNPAGTGGAQLARAILFGNVLDGAGSVRRATAVVRQARVKPDSLIGLDAAATEDLSIYGIIVDGQGVAADRIVTATRNPDGSIAGLVAGNTTLFEMIDVGGPAGNTVEV